MNFYEQEMRQMFGDTDIIKDAKYAGRTMLGKLDEAAAELRWLGMTTEDICNHLRGGKNDG